MKHKLFLLITAILIVISMIVIFSLYNSYTEEIDLADRTVTVIIKSGSTFSDISSQLLQEKVINSRIMFKYPARIKGIDKKLTPGRYDFSGKNSCRSILERLEKGDFLKVKVTIPEGNTIWETSALLAHKLDLDSASIHNLQDDTTFLQLMQIPTLEGYLFPETYYFAWGIDEKSIVEELVAMFKQQTKNIWIENPPNNLTQEEIIIMASIIESETGIGGERKLVSSVYHNRLRIKMKLDADPTVIYGLGGLTRPLYKKDLRKDTAYNTYMHKGLPPTPINSPGLASIEAALSPENTDYFYFVADTNGTHYFSKTIREHTNAINRIRSKK